MTVDDIDKVKRNIRAELDQRGIKIPANSLSSDTIILVSADFLNSVRVHVMDKNNLVDILHIMTSGCICVPAPWLSGEDFEIRTRFSIHNLEFSDN